MITNPNGNHPKVSINVDDLCKLIQYASVSIDGINIDLEEISNGLYECLRYARKDPARYRDERHDLLSRRAPEDVSDSSPLKKIYSKYGARSIYTNTAARMVSLIKLTPLEVKKRTKEFKPPAFDISLPYSESVPDNMNAYKLLDKWRDIPGLRDIIYKLRNVRTYYENRYSDPNKRRIILLDNNSSQGYCSGTVNITDLMGNIYYYPPLVDKITNQDVTFPHLNRLVGLLNSRDDDDPFAYLMKEDQFNGYKFNVVAIADKDGKIRIIFQGSNDIQTISKGMHELLDSVARSLEGNYTYNQRDWIKNLVSKGWHTYKHIIGTDMSKYSDTLHRQFMLEILRRAGFTEDELRELDILYSAPVRNVNGDIIGDVISTMASYQGQYGDFPLITICNLALQSMVMYILGSAYDNDHDAAVGDDTGMIFDVVKENAMEVIVNVYGSVGVRINKLKTGQLNGPSDHGEGVVDFVKLRFDRYGIIPYLEPKPYFTEDFDQAIRDIYDSIFLSEEQKERMFEILFGVKAAKILMDKSIINGGINMRVIEPRDVNELLSNRIMLTDLNKLKFGTFYTWLNQAYKELLDCGYSWRDTVFSELKECKEKEIELRHKLDDNDITYDEYNAQLDGFIMLQIAKVAELGSDFAPSEYHELVGNDPDIIYKNHKDKMMRRKYNKALERLYTMIKSNESTMGRLKKKGVKKSRTVYKDKLEVELGSDTTEDWLNIAKNMKHMLVQFESLQDYTENVKEAAKATNAYKTLSYLKGIGMIFSRKNPYGEHWYVRFNGVQYRLFDDHPNSIYRALTEDIRVQIPLLKDWTIPELFEYYRQF